VKVTLDNSDSPPLKHRLVTWLVQPPLLFYAVHGAFSVFSPNGAFAVGGSTVVDTDPAAGSVRLIVWATTLLALLLMFPIANSAFSIFSRNRYVAALVVLAAASILWSQDPSASLQKAFYLFVTTCFGYYLVERFSPRQLMQVVMITGAIAIIGSLVLAVALPRYGVFTGRADESSGWQGIYTHKNTLGLITMYFLAPALFLPFNGTREKFWRFLYIGSSLFLVAMSRSRGAWIMTASLLVFALIVTVGSRLRPEERVAAYWALGAVFVVGSAITWAVLPVILAVLHKDMTLTGRTTIWSVLLTSLAKRPWLGFGYSAFWVGTKGESANAIYALRWPRLSYAENGVLQLALELGVVGVGLYFLAYLRCYRRLRRLFSWSNGTPELFWYGSTLFLAAITNIEAGSIASPNSWEWLIFVMTAGSIHKKYEEIRHQVEGRHRVTMNPMLARTVRSGAVQVMGEVQ
jgi:exopolysaccharide production protein ExoQ